MRVLILSGGDLAGGAYKAAFRLHQALRSIGVESFMAVRRKHSNDPHVYKMTPSELGWPPLGRGYLDALPMVLRRRKDEPIFLGVQSVNLEKLIKRFKPDLVNFHWINNGISSIRAAGGIAVPAVWTMHDMWPLTGGCGYSGNCTEYRASCQRCPKIKDVFRAPSLTHWVYRRKRKHWGKKPLYGITPSAWMKQVALSSSLFANAHVTHIPNCIDSGIFSGSAREKTRVELGLKPDTHAILFAGANQVRKGANIIPEVIQRLVSTNSVNRYRFLFMGGLPPALAPAEHIVDLPRSTDEKCLASYYAASDVYALPSLEDNLPNTISESLNCGTPVAAFPTGGIVEMIQDGINGALSSDQQVLSFSNTIERATSKLARSRADIARDAAAMYSPNKIARAHLQCFEGIIRHSAESLRGTTVLAD